MNIAGILKEGLCAFFPIYDEGNVTNIITGRGGQVVIRKTCRTVLKNFARFYGIDLAAARKHYGSFINKKQGVPIPLAADLLLIPVKFRKNPLGENDGTLGYVNFRSIKHIEEDTGGKCFITFHCGTKLQVLVSRRTMKEYMKNASLVESFYLKQHFYQNGDFKGENREKGLREYLLKLLLEIIQMHRNQASR